MPEEPYSASLAWTDGLQFVGKASQSGIALVMDGSSEHGGTDSGIRPQEALLMSLAGCTGMDVISILKKKRQQVTRFWVNARGTRAEEYPRRFTRIELEYVVRGWGISPEAVERSIELSQTKYCPVTANINAEIVYTYRIEEETVPEEH